jgi:hypothetical protein
MKIYSVTTVLGKYFDWSKIPDQILAEACTRGSLVHSACAARALGGYVGRLPGLYAGYYKSFCNWYENNVKATIFCEHRITCEKLGFTGQLDFVFLLNTSETALVDIKTPVSLGKTWKCQLSAYSHLLETVDFSVDALMSLRLRMSGGAALGDRYEGERVSSFNVFKSALNAHRNLI